MRGKLVHLLIVIVLLSGAASAVLPWSVPQGTHAANTSPLWNGRISSPGRTSVAYGILVPGRSKRRAVGKQTRPYVVPPQTAEFFHASSVKILPVIEKSGATTEHMLIANEVMLSLPEKCRDTLKNFYVRYDHPESRGLGGKNSIIVSGNVPDHEFRALFIHELAHNWDLGCLTGTVAAGASEFKDGKEAIYNDDPSVQYYRISWSDEEMQKTETKSEDFASGYASWDPFEDLAESSTYYVLHQSEFRKRAKENAAMAAKLAWLEIYFFPSGTTLATSREIWGGKVPWDTTKLSYTWHPGASVAQK